MLYRLELGDAITSKNDEKIGQVNRKLANQLRILNEIARKQNIPIIVTNQVYSSFNRDEKNGDGTKETFMVGGDLLKYWSKCLLELQNYKGRRKIILHKHRSLPSRELEFEINNIGIKKRGFF
jgi:DNA repair protein RadB